MVKARPDVFQHHQPGSRSGTPRRLRPGWLATYVLREPERPVEFWLSLDRAGGGVPDRKRPFFQDFDELKLLETGPRRLGSSRRRPLDAAEDHLGVGRCRQQGDHTARDIEAPIASSDREDAEAERDRRRNSVRWLRCTVAIGLGGSEGQQTVPQRSAQRTGR
jgi:hypothetical protein